LNLKSLNLSNHITIPFIGLRALSKKITTLTSLTCSHIFFISRYDISVIVDSYPFLEELDLSFPEKFDGNANILSSDFPNLRKVNLSGNYIFLLIITNVNCWFLCCYLYHSYLYVPFLCMKRFWFIIVILSTESFICIFSYLRLLYLFAILVYE
jgi:hypothetical protein